MEINILHDEHNQRFYVRSNEKDSELKYKKVDANTLEYYTVFVPESLRNQEIASKICSYALQYAKNNNLQIIASCPYVKNYIDEHPEYQQLVKKNSKNTSDSSSIKKYWPLFSLILVSLLAALSINWHLNGDMRTWMHYFMGIFLLIFSLLKIFHPVDFADGFRKYDIIAKKWKVYAYCYPLIELFLGLAFLSFFLPMLTYLVTMIILTVGAIGVINGLRQGLDINCPCMGTVLEVPLSTVTLTEDIGMALMALILFITMVYHYFT